MASSINSDSGAISGSAGLKYSADATGNLVLQTNGSNAVTIDTDQNVTLNSTGAIKLSVGNTAQRPTGANGMMRYSTTTNSFEGYAAGAWGAIGGSSGGGLTWSNTVQTGNFTASSGNAYFVNTTSAAIYATLPSSPSLGNIITFVDYAQTFGTYNLIVNPNGAKINGSTSNITLATTGEAVGLVYSDSTRGWVAYDGFVNNPTGIYSIDYLIVAGGGGGAAGYGGGGGGGGGAVIATTSVTPGTAYSIVIGSGGAGYPGYNTGGWVTNHGVNGTPSTGFSQTAVGGGGGGGSAVAGYNGGSGGGGGDSQPGGSGTAGQGYAGGAGVSGGNYGAGGGGGAGGPGSGGSQPAGGAGGPGVNWQSLGSYYAGGGGGGTYNGGSGGPGGSGGGGAGSNSSAAGGTGGSNTGGGGGGGNGQAGPTAFGGGGPGGSGIAIVRYLGGQRGTGGTITSSGGYTYHTFNSSATFTA